MYSPKESKAWKLLQALAEQNKNDQMTDYFENDSARFSKMSLKASGLFLDYSKNKITPQVLQTLLFTC